MRNRVVVVLAPIFALTGFSALTLQVVWQRVISLHSGVDLASITTVVAAFLAGLGIGNLIGGALADRLGPVRSVALFSAANVGIGVFAWLSLLLFYDLYRELAPNLQSTFASFVFNAAILLIPTTLMGLSLPLVARAVTSTVADAGALIGRMYGINTIGAAVGAMVAGWFLLGELGFANTVRLAGSLNLVAAALIFALYRTLRDRSDSGAPGVGAITEAAADAGATAAGPRARAGNERDIPVGVWYAIYGLTGAVALGLEQVFFRTIDAVMRSNSYSFAHVLTLYLVLFGLGSAIGSRLVRRARDPRKWFLWMQFSVGVAALTALTGLIKVLPKTGQRTRIESYFGGAGYNGGFGDIETFRQWAKVVVIYGGVPLGLMTLPVLLMGMSFPFVQSIVADRVETLGRRTGLLLFTNIVGNVVGTIVTGFVLIDNFGTAGTYKFLCSLLGVAGLAAAWLATGARRAVALAAVVAILGTLVAVSPNNQRFWAFMHGVTDGELLVAEDHACATTIRFYEDQSAMLYINASIQNGYPFDDFHVAIGLLPALVQESPRHALAIGLGIGATSYGMLQDPRVERVDTVELCGAEYDLIRTLADRGGRDEFRRLLDDPRFVAHTGDGRKYLIKSDERFDILTVDTLRTTSAFSGSLYSKEFYELVDSRLADTGIVAQWVPSPRVANTAAQVFPYIMAFSVAEYNDGSVFMLASRAPIDFDRQKMLTRLGNVPTASFSAVQRASLESFVRNANSFCYANGEVLGNVPSYHENTDLRPRDEYFVNNGFSRTLPSC